jgi:putative hydrolase
VSAALVDLDGDFHVHSTFSDDAESTLAENLDAAHERGITTIRLVEHVRRSTAWVPDFLAAVARESRRDDLVVLTGVEAKLLDATGRLDLPPELTGVDTVLIADHQFPSPEGEPWTPTETRRRLAGDLSVEAAMELLITGLVKAMQSTPSAQLAHCFSILPKIGLDEDDLNDDQLARWADSAAGTGTSIELNEKWHCPGPRAVAAALAAGAELVAATDSHVASDVGRYDWVRGMVEAP